MACADNKDSLAVQRRCARAAVNAMRDAHALVARTHLRLWALGPHARTFLGDYAIIVADVLSFHEDLREHMNDAVLALGAYSHPDEYPLLVQMTREVAAHVVLARRSMRSYTNMIDAAERAAQAHVERLERADERADEQVLRPQRDNTDFIRAVFQSLAWEKQLKDAWRAQDHRLDASQIAV